MIIIGITGGSGAGKTTVAKTIAKRLGKCVLQDLSTQYCKEKVHTFAPEIFL